MMCSLKMHVGFFLLDPFAHLRALALGNGFTVRSGPFRGMKYVDRAAGSAFPGKVLGTYEKELHPALRLLDDFDPATIIDVGAAEGYYAVGLALRHPNARVVAYEADRDAVPLLRRLAAANGVASRLDILGVCSPDALHSILAREQGSRVAVLCDAEGAEAELFSPDISPFVSAFVLIETHDFLSPGVTERLAASFSPTHEVTVLEMEPRTLRDLPRRSLLGLLFPSRVRRLFLDERRPHATRWIIAVPRNYPSATDR